MNHLGEASGLELLLGFLLGLVGSWLAWRLTLSLYRPSVTISDAISVRYRSAGRGSGEHTVTYRFKIRNDRRTREVHNLAVEAQVVILGLNPHQRNNATTFRIPVALHPLFPVLYRRDRRWRKQRSGWRDYPAARTYTLHPELLIGGGEKWFTEPIAALKAAGLLTLHDLLGLGFDSKLRVLVTCQDSLSGVGRSHTQIYRLADLAIGSFESHDSLRLTDKPADGS